MTRPGAKKYPRASWKLRKPTTRRGPDFLMVGRDCTGVGLRVTLAVALIPMAAGLIPSLLNIYGTVPNKIAATTTSVMLASFHLMHILPYLALSLLLHEDCARLSAAIKEGCTAASSETESGEQRTTVAFKKMQQAIEAAIGRWHTYAVFHVLVTGTCMLWTLTAGLVCYRENADRDSAYLMAVVVSFGWSVLYGSPSSHSGHPRCSLQP
jgi:hypothetical protein